MMLHYINVKNMNTNEIWWILRGLGVKKNPRKDSHSAFDWKLVILFT